MIRERFHFRETFANILADDPAHTAAAKSGMMAARQDLEAYIARDPFFSATFDPYEPDSDNQVITRMAEAGRKAGVGPMAAVAGTIAWAGIEAMREAGATFGVIDNGGDIALVANRPVRVGVHAGGAPLSNRVAFVIPPQESVLGICTSSATVGPSVSFGMADAVTVFARDVALADAWATAVCNAILPDDRSVLDRVDPYEVAGIFAIMGDITVRWGELPPLVPAVVDEGLISAGDR
ncbi:MULTISPECIES: UPF0280 family protein [unclassified Methanoregula]|uniref:UPF0280 family protein n=1 Tax=unclassified Methanoregula TaxID=2649730 RepID=UPI0009C777DA|nr:MULTISPECIES: UPF0280 family protein [unclassified Methanoregula]OPX65245.1 MAG: hypothetical protein A4E33_00277 [Methanoregula sp. PtaB.Bin085]OPY32154.1 MAG: hypothetical protein A4E34_02527 [Methanoregula sp. PtaU1.Bin006]